MNEEERKEYAKRILENPLWKEVMEKTQADLYQMLLDVDLTDTAQQQAIAGCAQWLDTIERHLVMAFHADKVAQFNLDQRKKVI